MPAHAPGPYADPPDPMLPPTDVTLQPGRAALVVTDPQIDFLRARPPLTESARG
jgi:biuret amidohydrolase